MPILSISDPALCVEPRPLFLVLATKAKPKLLVVYHTVSFPPGITPPKFLSSSIGAGMFRSAPEVLQDEIGSRYSGQFVIGRDLDVY